jgi:hypothetical protein
MHDRTKGLMQNAKCKGVSKRGSNVGKSLSMLFFIKIPKTR